MQQPDRVADQRPDALGGLRIALANLAHIDLFVQTERPSASAMVTMRRRTNDGVAMGRNIITPGQIYHFFQLKPVVP